MPISPPTSSTGDIYDIRMRFALGQSGWTETYRFAATRTGSQADILGVASGLVAARRKFLTSSGSVKRVSLVPVAVWDAAATPPAYVKPDDRGSVPVPREYYGNGLVTLPPYDTTSAVNVRLYAGNGLYRRVAQFRGMSTEDFRFSPTGEFATVAAGSPSAAGFVAFYDILSNSSPAGPAAGLGTFVLKGQDRSARTVVGQVEEAAPDISGCYTVLTMDRPPTGIAQGDRVHVHGVGGCGVRGLNGDTTVISVGALNSVTIDKKNCCCEGGGTVKPGGTLTTIDYAYYDIQPTPAFLGIPMSPGRRKTGAARVATRGRRRKRCK